MKILDDYIYYITLAFAAIGIGTIMYLKKTKWIEKYNDIIRYTLASGATLINIEFIIYQLVRGGYHHILFTDLCPFILLIAIPALIWGNKKSYKFIGPWAIIGALLTMIMGSPGFMVEPDFGSFAPWLSYFRHLFLLIIGIFMLFMITPYKRKEYIYVLFIPVVLFTWIIIGCGIPYWVTGEEKWAVYSTGLLEPSYKVVQIDFNGHHEAANNYAFIEKTNIPFPVPSLLLFITGVGAASGTMYLSKFFKINKNN